MTVLTKNPKKPATVLQTILPGPDRKREPQCYSYKLVYRSNNPDQIGCVMLWEVHGGRTPYQIAIERDESGEMHSHCTCADAIFRHHLQGHVCKHVLGFLHLGRAQPMTEEAERPLAACA